VFFRFRNSGLAHKFKTGAGIGDSNNGSSFRGGNCGLLKRLDAVEPSESYNLLGSDYVFLIFGAIIPEQGYSLS
jgi:hypothetical protein